MGKQKFLSVILFAFSERPWPIFTLTKYYSQWSNSAGTTATQVNTKGLNVVGGAYGYVDHGKEVLYYYCLVHG